MSDFFHLVLAGNIGAGKTTLTTLLSEEFGWRAYFERVDENPFLEDFYGDMDRWAFPLQLYFLTHRLEDHRLIAERRESAIQDRSIHEDALIFARNLYEMAKLSEREWSTYQQLYRQLLALLRPPDLVVYLRSSVAGLLRNIHQRGRDYETGIPSDYLARLNAYYEDWIATPAPVPALVVAAEEFDFLDNAGDLLLLAERIRAASRQRDLFEDRPSELAPDPRFALLKARI